MNISEYEFALEQAMLSCLAESDVDLNARSPGGLNMAADMLFGGPVKVSWHYHTMIASGSLQAVLVILPMVRVFKCAAVLYIHAGD